MNRPALGFLLLFCALGSCPAFPGNLPSSKTHDPGQRLHVAGIPNAGKIDEHLYRGAQPQDGSLTHLRELGITTIVDLRGEDSSLRERERREADALEIRFISIPVGGFSPPAKDQITTFLSLFMGQSPGTVFVHCRRGEDRTGVFIAAYRIVVDNWTADEAIKEMRFFGFNRLWHPSMVSYIRNFPSLIDSDPTLSALSSSLRLAASH
jgi:protein tyrosine/serine phosphatase